MKKRQPSSSKVIASLSLALMFVTAHTFAFEQTDVLTGVIDYAKHRESEKYANRTRTSKEDLSRENERLNNKVEYLQKDVDSLERKLRELEKIVLNNKYRLMNMPVASAVRAPVSQLPTRRVNPPKTIIVPIKTPVRVKKHVCSISTPFNGTFIGKASSKVEAMGIALQKCEKSGERMRCKKDRLMCDVTE